MCFIQRTQKQRACRRTRFVKLYKKFPWKNENNQKTNSDVVVQQQQKKILRIKENKNIVVNCDTLH